MLYTRLPFAHVDDEIEAELGSDYHKGRVVSRRVRHEQDSRSEPTHVRRRGSDGR